MVGGLILTTESTVVSLIGRASAVLAVAVVMATSLGWIDFVLDSISDGVAGDCSAGGLVMTLGAVVTGLRSDCLFVADCFLCATICLV